MIADESENAFHTLQMCLTTTPVLSLPDFTQPFLIQTDELNAGLGCVLSQIKDKLEHAIAYAVGCRTLNEAEQNYSTTVKEMLALVFAIKQFQPYLIDHTVIIKTDHAPIQQLFKRESCRTFSTLATHIK